MENSNIWAEARCKKVIPSRTVDNIITNQGRKAFDGIIFLLLFVMFLIHCLDPRDVQIFQMQVQTS